MSWEQFKKKTPRYSIALDGFVGDAPQYDAISKHINFDHHFSVARLATMSTAQQVFYAINGEFLTYFMDEKNKKPHVYTNDSDPDVSLAVFTLENYLLLEQQKILPVFEQLLETNAKLDITGGSFPLNHESSSMKKHHWIFEPYKNFRKSGKLFTANAKEIRTNIDDCCERIEQFLAGKAKEAELDTRYDILYKGKDFWMVHEIGGPDSRYALYTNGMRSFINLIGTRPDGKYVWTIGKRSEFIPFPVTELYDVFNKAEGITKGPGWGGSTIIGGSPRLAGSSLDWQDLKEITQDYLKKKNKE
jgi:hypothetical protein